MAGLTGTLMATSCSTEQIQTIVRGIGEIVDDLENEQDDDISFGNWLQEEIGEL